MVAMVATVEAQNSFAYQAVIRNAKGELVSNCEVSMQFSLIYDGQVVYCETHKTKTNEYGNVQVKVGEGTLVKGSFAAVPWSSMNVMMKIEVDPKGGTNYIDLGTIQLQPSPYAMYAPAAGKVNMVQAGEPKSDSDALFEVKDKDGNVVFAVYRDGVRVFVDDSDSYQNGGKPKATGFAVAGRKAGKDGEETDIFTVNAEGTQVFVGEEDMEGGKPKATGFAVAGRKAGKDGSNDLFTVSSTGTQIYIDPDNYRDDSKPKATGFAVAGRKAGKDGQDNKYLEINSDGTRVYIDDYRNDSKPKATGFAVAGRKAGKDEEGNKYMEVTADGTQIFVNEDDGKPKATGFAVAGRKAGKNSGLKLFEVNSYGTRIYIDPDRDGSKPKATGFAVAGRKAGKGGNDPDSHQEKYMVIDADGTHIYIDYEDAKAVRTGFAVAGRKATKEGAASTIFEVNNDGTRAYIDDDPDSKPKATGFAVAGRKAGKAGVSELLKITGNSTLLAVDKALTVQDKTSDANILVMTQERTNITTDVFAFIEAGTNNTILAADNKSIDVNADIVVRGDVAQTVESELAGGAQPITMTVVGKIDTLDCAQAVEALGDVDGFSLLKIYGNGLFALPQSVDADSNSYILFDGKGRMTSLYEDAVAAVVMTNASTLDAKVLVWPLKQCNSLKISFGITSSDSSNLYVNVDAYINAKDGVVNDVKAETAENGSVEIEGRKVYGEPVIFKAIPDEGYHFSRWNDSLTYNPRTLRFAGSASLQALFDINVYEIKVQASAGGTVEGAGTYNHGDEVTLTAMADDHCHFVNWNGNSELDKEEYKFVAKENATLTATFAVNTNTVAYKIENDTVALEVVAYGDSIRQPKVKPTKPGFKFLGWNIQPLIMPDEPVSILGSFEAIQYTVAFVNGNDTLYSNKYLYGETPVYGGTRTPSKTADAQYEYTFNGWPAIVEVSKDTAYAAQFTSKLRSYAVTASASPEGYGEATISGAQNQDGTYNYGTQITLTAEANHGYKFVKWNDDNTSDSRTVKVEGDNNYIAEFEVDYKTLTVNVAPAGAGSVTAVDDNGNSITFEKVSENAGQESYQATVVVGTTVTLTATTDATGGYQFKNWTVGENTSTGAYTIESVSGDMTLSANFELKSYLVTVMAYPNMCQAVTGVVEKDGNSENVTFTDAGEGNYGMVTGGSMIQVHKYTCTVSHGSKLTISATANENYEFSYWKIGGEPKTDESLVIENVTGEQTVELNFRLETKLLTIGVTKNAGAVAACYVLSEGEVSDITLTEGVSSEEMQYFTARCDIGSTVRLHASAESGYEFKNWVNGESVLTGDNYEFEITDAVSVDAVFEEKVMPNYIVKEFSVADGKKVYFSQGNLQYQGSTNTWRFAEYQYDAVDPEKLAFTSTYNYSTGKMDLTTEIGPDYDEWIDHFGWGSSGYNGVQPYNRDYSQQVTVNGTTKTIHTLLHIAGMTGQNAQYDWGVHNRISNGGNEEGMWRTLTFNEWNYLVNERANAASLRAPARVNGYAGLVLLPDDWIAPEGIEFTTTMTASYYDGWATNTFTPAQWARMEGAGAVFLPASGLQEADGNWQKPSHNNGNSYGTIYLYYWTASATNNVGYDVKYAIYTCLSSKQSTVSSYQPSDGTFLPVRLVQDAPDYTGFFVAPSGAEYTGSEAIDDRFTTLADAMDKISTLGDMDAKYHIIVSGDYSGENVEVTSDGNSAVNAHLIKFIGMNDSKLGTIDVSTGSGDTVWFENIQISKFDMLDANIVLANGAVVDGNEVGINSTSSLTMLEGSEIKNVTADDKYGVNVLGKFIMKGGSFSGNTNGNVYVVYDNDSPEPLFEISGNAEPGMVYLGSGAKITIGGTLTSTADTVAIIVPESYPTTSNPTVTVLTATNGVQLTDAVCKKFAVMPYQPSPMDEPVYYKVNTSGNLEQACMYAFFESPSNPEPFLQGLASVNESITGPADYEAPEGCTFSGWQRIEMVHPPYDYTFTPIDLSSYKVKADDKSILLYPTFARTIYVSGSATAGSGDGTSASPYASIDEAASVINTQTVDYTLKLNGTFSYQTIPASVYANSITIDGAPEAGTPGGANAVIDGTGGHDGALAIGTPIPVTIQNLTVQNGYSQRGGGGISAEEISAKLTLGSGVLITNNSAHHGGGVAVAGNSKANMRGKLTILDGCVIKGNTATQQGGGICASEADVYIEGGTVGGDDESSSNKAEKGGGIYIGQGDNYDNSTITMSGGTIIGNKANGVDDEDTGGGVYIASGTKFYMEDGTITGNQASYGGGIFANSGATFVMSGGTISENEGFAVYTLADFTMSGSAKIPPLVGDDESVTNTVFLVPGAKIIIGKDGLASDTDIVATITPDTYPENYPYDDELIVLAKENGSLSEAEIKRFDVADAMINSTFTYWDVDSDGALRRVAKYNFYNCVYEDESSLDNERTVVKVPMDEYVTSPQLEARTNYEFKGWYRVERDGDGYPEGLASEPTDFDYYTVDEYSYESFFAVWERDPIYVGQNNQSASQQKGTLASPYSSIETAVSNMNDKDADFVIKVIGTLEGMQQISSSLTSEKAHSLTIEGYYGIDEEETHEPQDELKNTEEDMGRVLYSTTEVPVTIRNLKITGGANLANMGSVYGTGIYIKGGEMTLDEGTLITGNSNEILSIIYCENAQLTMKDGCRITDNTAKKGAVYLTGSTFVMEGGEISNITGVLYDRQHSGYSGAVDVESNSTFEMRGGTISNITNSENEPALGVNAYGSNLTIKMSDDAQIAAENAVGLSLNIKINIDGDLKKDKVATILPTSGHIYNNEPVQVLDGDLTQYEKFAVVPDLDDNNWLIGSDGKLMPLVYFVQETGVEDNDYGQGGNDSNTGIKPGRLTAFKTIDKAIQTINGRNDDQHDYTIVICSPTTETINPVNLSSGSVIAQSLTFKGRKATNIENYTLSNVVVNTSMPVKFENLTIASIADANDEGQNIELRSGAKVTGYVQVMPSMQFTMFEGSEVGSIYSEGNLIMHGGEVTGGDTDSDGINDVFVDVAGDGTFTMSGTAKPNHVKADKIFIDGELKGDNITILDLYDYEGSISQQVIVFAEGVTGTLPVSRFQLADDRYAIDDEGKVKKIVPTGAIKGRFSVGEGKQVYFSQGNLQYLANNGEGGSTWRFAENQWDYAGTNNLYVSNSYTGWIDLFGWGTGDNPTNQAQNNAYYGTFTDWGKNAISNGGNEAGQWRTLTIGEWEYLLNTRGSENQHRYAKAIVHNVNGLVLLPDNWSADTYTFTTVNTANASFETVADDKWNTIEAAGAVFLPAEGNHNPDNPNYVDGMGTYGAYWSSTPYTQVVAGEEWWLAYRMLFRAETVTTSNEEAIHRFIGRSVRLVQDLPDANAFNVPTDYPTFDDAIAAIISKDTKADYTINVTGVGANCSISSDLTTEHATSLAIIGLNASAKVDIVTVNTSVPVKLESLEIASISGANEGSQQIELRSGAKVTGNVQVPNGMTFTMQEGSQVKKIYCGGAVVMHGGEVTGVDSDGDNVIDECVELAGSGTLTMSGSAKPHQVKTNNKIIIDGDLTYNDDDNYITVIDFYNYESMLGQPVLERADGFDGELPFDRFALKDEGYEIDDNGAVKKKENGTSQIAPEGAINGKFSVGEGKQVYFSQGNLQYQASSGTWRFAQNQYDYVGVANANISADYTGWIDLFGWGTGDNPTQTSTNDADYTAFNDWGNNVTEYQGSWRTLTKEEWQYLKNRDGESKYGMAAIDAGESNTDYVVGCIILPDDWILPEGLSFNSGIVGSPQNKSAENYAISNHYTQAQWQQMQTAGAVFLPAAGYYNPTNEVAKVEHTNLMAVYWIKSEYTDIQYNSQTGDNEAPCLGICHYIMNTDDGSKVTYRLSVRLVQDVESGIGSNTQTIPEGFVHVQGTAADTHNSDYGNAPTSVNALVCNHMVTQAEYEELMTYYGVEVGGDFAEFVPDPNDDKSTTPAYFVSWADAVIYCNLLSIRDGLEPVYSIGGETDPDNMYDVSKNSSGKYYMSKNYPNDGDLLSWDDDSSSEYDLSKSGWRVADPTEYMIIANQNVANNLGIVGKNGIYEWCNVFGLSNAERLYFRGDITQNIAQDDDVFAYTKHTGHDWYKYDSNTMEYYLLKLGFRIVRNAPAQNP